MKPETLKEARAAMTAKNFAVAEDIARASIAQAPDAQGYEMLANALRAQERLEEALVAAEHAVRLDDGNNGAHHSRAFILSRLGRFADALAIYDQLTWRGVTQPSVWLNRSVALLGLTRDADAEATLMDGVRRWPQDVGLQNMLASLRWMRGGGEDFTRDYEAAVRREPDSLWLRIGCADLLRRADLHARAEEVLSEGLQRTPGSGALQGALGVLLDEMDRTSEGLPLLYAAVADAPNVSYVRGNLINGLLRLGRGDEALREILPLRAAQPLNGDWVCYEAMAYIPCSESMVSPSHSYSS